MADYPSRDSDAFIAHWTKLLGDDGVVAGNIVSWDNAGRREVGYWIDRAHWGTATDALGQLIVEIPIRPLYAHVAANNLGSIRVLEKCGVHRTAASVEPPESGASDDEVVLVLD